MSDGSPFAAAFTPAVKVSISMVKPCDLSCSIYGGIFHDDGLRLF